MTAIGNKIRQKLEAATANGLAEYRQLVMDACNAVDVDPEQAEAVIENAGKSIDEFERDCTWFENRLKRIEGIEAAKAARVDAEIIDGKLAEIVAKRRSLVAPIDIEIAKLTEERDALQRQWYNEDQHRQQLLNTRPQWITPERAGIAQQLESRRTRRAYVCNELERMEAVNEAARKDLVAINRSQPVVVDPRADAIVRNSQRESQAAADGQRQSATMRLQNSSDALNTARAEIQSLDFEIKELEAKLRALDGLHTLPWPTPEDVATFGT